MSQHQHHHVLLVRKGPEGTSPGPVVFYARTLGKVPIVGTYLRSSDRLTDVTGKTIAGRRTVPVGNDQTFVAAVFDGDDRRLLVAIRALDLVAASGRTSSGINHVLQGIISSAFRAGADYAQMRMRTRRPRAA